MKKHKKAEPASIEAKFQARTERIAAGKLIRDKVPRAVHATWKPKKANRDPVEILEKSNKGRLPELIPIRYGRMVRSPFTFLRGSASLMAHDLASLPKTDLIVQACGDCHLLNFGLCATPERKLVFDLNDFDETLPAPWEWDIKRLTASFVVAGRDNGISEKDSRDAAVLCARNYRERLRAYSKMSPVEVWYECMDMDEIIKMAPDEETKKTRERFADKARERVVEHLFPKIAAAVGGAHRLIDQPPVLFHVQEAGIEERFREGLTEYRETLSDDRKVLFDRYALQDFAMKIVGIGSVGTRCLIGLFFSEENHPLILQIKEARDSVLQPYTKPSIYENQGQRVVMGQRLMQSSSDIFLGWVRSSRGYDFYVRQLRDMKLSVLTEGVNGTQLKRYAEFCGWALARAHAKSGDAATISGYLGKGDEFDEALGDFAIRYADQTEHDHAQLVKAERAGRIEVLKEEEV